MRGGAATPAYRFRGSSVWPGGHHGPGPEYVDDVDYSCAPAKALEEGPRRNAGLDRPAQCLVTLSCTDAECVSEPNVPVIFSV